MSMTEKKWQPGDVAVVPGFGRVFAGDDGIWSTTTRKTNTPWRDLGDGRVPFPDVRPLVVIDPEDREQVERLAKLWVARVGDFDTLPQRMATILREFANPTPPIEEPTEAASLVEDEDGAIWARQCTQGGGKDMSRPWMQLVNGRVAGPLDRERDWRGINVVRVLSEGVPAEVTP